MAVGRPVFVFLPRPRPRRRTGRKRDGSDGRWGRGGGTRGSVADFARGRPGALTARRREKPSDTARKKSRQRRRVSAGVRFRVSNAQTRDFTRARNRKKRFPSRFWFGTRYWFLRFFFRFRYQCFKSFNRYIQDQFWNHFQAVGFRMVTNKIKKRLSSILRNTLILTSIQFRSKVGTIWFFFIMSISNACYKLMWISRLHSIVSWWGRGFIMQKLKILILHNKWLQTFFIMGRK